MIPISFTHCLNTDCKTEVDEEFEEGEIVEEDDTENFVSIGQNTELQESNENLFLESLKEKCSKPLLEVEQRPHQMSHQQMVQDPLTTNFSRFNNENEGEFCSLKKFNGRGREIHGVNKGRISRDTDVKQQMITGLFMENKQYDVKKKICKYFLRGNCFKDDNCEYTHQRPKGHNMKLCKFYLYSYCPRENQCTFMHSDFPCKHYHTGKDCYSGKHCRFSHAKIDNDKKYMFQKLFGKLCDDPAYIQNKLEKKRAQIFESKNVHPKFKSTEKNSDKYPEGNHNNNSYTPKPQPLSQDAPIVDNTLISNIEEFPTSSNHNYSCAIELGKSDIDLRQLTYKFPITTSTEIEASTDGHPPIKYHLLPFEVPVQDYSKIRLNMIGINDQQHRYGIKAARDPKCIQNDSETVSEVTVGSAVPNKNIVNRDPRKRPRDIHLKSAIQAPVLQTPYPFLSYPTDINMRYISPTNLSKVEQVNIYEANSDYLAKLPSTTSRVNKTTIGIQPSPLEMPYDFEETIQDEISNIEEFPTSSNHNYSCAIELGKSDIDLRQLTYKFPITTSTEIEASIDSHPPIKYHLIPFEVPVQDYSKIRLNMIGINDQQHRYGIKAARDPKYIQNDSETVSEVTVGSAVPNKNIVNRDPRKRPRDILLKSAIQAPVLQTPYPFLFSEASKNMF